MYKKALKIAYNAHKGQYRNDDITPYIIHPIKVSQIFNGVYTETEHHGYILLKKIGAILHDVVEDTDITLNDLRLDFPKEVVETVDALTRRKNEKYFDYIKRLSKNKIAVEIKIADVIDNLSDGICSKSMIKRYNKTLDILIT